jgi:hypothetical protein
VGAGTAERVGEGAKAHLRAAYAEAGEYPGDAGGERHEEARTSFLKKRSKKLLFVRI